MMNVTSSRRAVAAVLAAVFFLAQQAQACPGCRQAVGMGDGASGSLSMNNVGLGYGLSIVGLLLTVASLIGGLGYVAYRNCQVIAARQQALLEAEEAEFGGLRA